MQNTLIIVYDGDRTARIGTRRASGHRRGLSLTFTDFAGSESAAKVASNDLIYSAPAVQYENLVQSRK